MSQNLLELVQNYFGGDTVRQASAALGQSESGVGTALGSVVPLVLGGLFAKAQQPGGTAELLDAASQAHSSGVLGNLSGLLGGLGGDPAAAPAADAGLLGRGTEMLRSALGGSYDTAVAGVSQQAGVPSSTVSSLLAMATPVVLGLMGKHAAENNVTASNFGDYLSTQSSKVMGALGNLPGGLGTVLSGLAGGLGGMAGGLGGMAGGVNSAVGSLAGGAESAVGDVKSAVSGLGSSGLGAAQNLGSSASAAAGRVGDAVGDTARGVPATAASPSRWPWLLLLLLGVAAALYFMRGCNKQPEAAAPVAPAQVADTTKARAAPTAPTGRFDAASGNYIYDTGAATEIKLSDGTVLKVGSNSLEARLFNFLNDSTQTVGADKTQGWMSLDRVYFTTGKAALTAESEAQLKNVAAILKAFPKAAIKLGGYTDDKGQAAMNMTLSASRANAARQAVVAAGVAADRVAAEGYGVAHPIAPNDTPAGRAQNRRVDVRVTKK